MTLLLNGRQHLYTGLLLLLVLHSVMSPTTPLLSMWGVEQQRWPGMTWQVVRRTVLLPRWYSRLRALIAQWRARSGKARLLWLACGILVLVGLLWLHLFRWVLCQMMTHEGSPGRLGWISVTPLPQETGSLEICLLAQVSPTVTETSLPLLAVGPASLALEAETQGPSPQTDESDPAASPERQEGEKKPRPKVTPYPRAMEQRMKRFYQTLSEKDRRRYAGVEALKLGHGGQGYIAQVLGCSRKTVAKGVDEVNHLSDDAGYERRIRKPGGGRKRYDETHADIDRQFLAVLKNHTAGNPMDETVLWTNLTPSEIAHLLEKEHRVKVSKTVVHQLLKKHHYRRRKAQKKRTMKAVPQRNEQFENIAQLVADYEATGNPTVSLDTKKKEFLGNFYRDGKLYTRQELETYDHDFNSAAHGVVIPHSLYDVRHNTGYITLGTSHDTSEFACDSFRNWWYNQGRWRYPHATSILALCDGGGSNSSRHYIFKQDLQKLADEIGIEIRIAHYPPYCSKYNPIEHRLFPHVTRACQGVVFSDMDLVKELMEKTKTKQGLTVTVQINDQEYETKREATADFKANMPIVFDDYLPQWNYTAVPNGKVN